MREGMQFQLCEFSTPSSASFADLIIKEVVGPSSSDRPFAGLCCVADVPRFGCNKNAFFLLSHNIFYLSLIWWVMI